MITPSNNSPSTPVHQQTTRENRPTRPLQLNWIVVNQMMMDILREEKNKES